MTHSTPPSTRAAIVRSICRRGAPWLCTENFKSGTGRPPKNQQPENQQPAQRREGGPNLHLTNSSRLFPDLLNGSGGTNESRERRCSGGPNGILVRSPVEEVYMKSRSIRVAFLAA